MGNVRSVTGLAGSSPAWALARELRERGGRTVVVCPREEEVENLLADTRFFLDLLGHGTSALLLPFPARPTDRNPSQLEEPHVRMARLNTLHQLLESPDPVVVFASFEALAQATLPKEQLIRFTNIQGPGIDLERDEFVRQLVEAGYEPESLVEEKGTFAVRGSILDLFPPNAENPFRFEFVGDTIESIRSFDPETQRSLSECEEAVWIPAREFILNEESCRQATARLKPLADSLDLPPSARHGTEDALEEKRYLPIMESLLTLFSSEPGSLFDFAGEQARWIVVRPFDLEQEKERLLLEFDRVAEELPKRRLLAVPPGNLSLSLDDVVRRIAELRCLELSDITLESGAPVEGHDRVRVVLHTDLRNAVVMQRKSESPLAPLANAIRAWMETGLRVLISAFSEGGAQRIASLLEPHVSGITRLNSISQELSAKADRAPVLAVGKLSSGFEIPGERWVFLTETEFFGERKHTMLPSVSREDAISSFNELNPGNPVVHIDHGVGIYRGLSRIKTAKVENDFLLIEYAGGDKLYLPPYRLSRIHKYVGADGGKPHIDRLGNPAAWERAKEKAAKAVEEMAQELIHLYAVRKVATGVPIGQADGGYLAFEADFPFEETRDQLRTLEEVSADLESSKPMDRLVCGDVGFGKTEVALRAAFRAALDGKQVAVLVPTTILAQQHFETFEKRFKEYPVRVDFLSRFKTAAEQKKVVQQLKEGSLDIVVGTHRLLSNDVVFADLGLLVVDEEHRFGVKHKEQIKKFRNQVHVLTLTATPIPRTLQLSMAGIRDLSVINTPPLDRKAIETFLCRAEDPLIRGAILKELARGGQVFFVHNRVETIHAMVSHLKKLVPEARFDIGHGQMTERELEEVMHRFNRREFDVLVCTTIIESGLDIPSANTILVNRADTFGLAQLYQLRGRVGRSDRVAYAYLLIPGEEIIGRDALKRLKALKNFTELGSGLKIALHDLEIRGAGNLLGSSQSGHIAAVGFELYTHLLEREVRRLKGEEVKEEIDPEIVCHLPAYLPDDYVPDTHQRLFLYKRFSNARRVEDLATLRAELTDRFGPIPPTVENLFRVVDLKILARERGIVSLSLTADRPSIEFSDQAPVNMDQLLRLVRKDKRVTLRPDNRLILELAEHADSFEETKKILLALG
ncbi:MAG: transcription-repair coupling factor [Pseudomonadota bacterium]